MKMAMNMISKKIAFHIGNWLQSLNMGAYEKSYSPESKYWEKRLTILKDAYENTTVSSIEYFNMKYMLVFYGNLLQYEILQILGLED